MFHRLRYPISALLLWTAPLVASGQSLKPWSPELNYRPIEAVQMAVMERPVAGGARGAWVLQKIEAGTGPLHLDYYGVKITKPPVLAGRPVSGPELIQWIRLTMEEFVDPALVQCRPIGETDRWLLQSKSAAGAVLEWDRKGPALPGPVALALVSSGPDRFLVSPVKPADPVLKPSPVTGTRTIGFQPGKGKDFTIFTRGTYRLAGGVDAAVAEGVLSEEEAGWRKFIGRVDEWVKNHGGATAAPDDEVGTVKVEWNTVSPGLFAPLGKWVDPEGWWASDDSKGRFSVHILPGLAECEMVEKRSDGALLRRTLPLNVTDSGWLLSRPNTDPDVLEFLGFREAIRDQILEAKPTDSTLTIRRRGNTLTAMWHGLSISMDGAGKLAAIKEPGSSRGKEYRFKPSKEPVAPVLEAVPVAQPVPEDE